MPLDAATLTALTGELRPLVEGAKIDKIFQPARDEVILALRTKNGNQRLLLTANPSQPRLQFTTVNRENPAAPPMFCMLLRKYLTGARILTLTQPPMERLVDLELEGRNELGDTVTRHLILEAMGRRANLILTDENGRITDCIRKVEADADRALLPGLFYRPPAGRADKHNPAETDRQHFSDLLSAAPPEREGSQWLLDTFAGISPLLCREIVYRAAGDVGERVHTIDPTALWTAFHDVLSQMEHPQPTALRSAEGYKDYSFLPITQYGDYYQQVSFPDFSTLLDEFYAQRERSERVRQKGQTLIRQLNNLRNRTARKIQVQRKELAAAQNREQYRLDGDLITANLFQMKKGQTTLTAVDYYDPEMRERTISLDPLLTPQQNAAKCYKRYNKAKTADTILTAQLQQGQQELDYLDSVLESLQRAEGERDLNEIRQELEGQGLLRAQKGQKKPLKLPKTKPMEYRSTAGLRISVGRNNTQNDQLTCKQAGKGDWWFHTKDIHGAHVILWTQGQQPDDKSVEEAALLAAWYSQARGGSKIPVDYAPVKYVKKPAGAKPGMVIYTTNQTMLVTPTQEQVDALAK